MSHTKHFLHTCKPTSSFESLKRFFNFSTRMDIIHDESYMIFSFTQLLLFSSSLGDSLLRDVMVLIPLTCHPSIQHGLMFDTGRTRTTCLDGLSRSHTLKGDIFRRDRFSFDGLYDRRIVLTCLGQVIRVLQLIDEGLTEGQILIDRSCFQSEK